jgi:hypothetical protein
MVEVVAPVLQPPVFALGVAVEAAAPASLPRLPEEFAASVSSPHPAFQVRAGNRVPAFLVLRALAPRQGAPPALAARPGRQAASARPRSVAV